MWVRENVRGLQRREAIGECTCRGLGRVRDLEKKSRDLEKKSRPSFGFSQA